MKPPHEGVENRLLWISRHLLAGSVVLLLVIFVSWLVNTPIRSIFPYAFAVGLVTWRHGMTAGFLFAGLATLAALATGAFPSREELSGQEVGEGLYTYLKLSAVAAGVALGKRVRRS
ncbi:hypothetical protein [Limnohabitans sp.]